MPLPSMPPSGIPRSKPLRGVLLATLVGMTSLLPGSWVESLAGQTPRGLTSGTALAASLMAQGDELHDALLPREAWDRYDEARAADPSHYPTLWRLAREGVFLGLLSEEDERETWFREAEAAGRAAVAEEPDGMDGLHWLGAALGMQALSGGPRTRVALAREIRELGERMVELDPLYAGGHHVLGQWHAEASRTTGITRFLARRVLGAAELDHASWEKARDHLSRAAELAPEGLIHHLELGKTLRDLGDLEGARSALRQVLERPAVQPTDPLHKQEAQTVLLAMGS